MIAEWVNVKDCGASGYGEADDTNAIEAAISALETSPSRTLVFPRGRYRTSRYLRLAGLSDVTIHGSGATIVYPSADESLIPDGVALSIGSARSAFYLLDCANVRIDGLSWEGNATERNFKTINQGAGVYVRNSSGVSLESCNQLYGTALLDQENQPNDRGLIISNGKSYGCRGVMTLGSDSRVEKHIFELPTGTDYDRVGEDIGSSHAIYIYSGRQNVDIDRCTFRNLRTWGFKASGTNDPIRNVRVSRSSFYSCGGGAMAGADNNQEHTGIVFSENYLENCGLGRAGWTKQYALHFLGSSGCKAVENIIVYTQNASSEGPGAAALAAIAAFRYRATTQPCETLTLRGNKIIALGGTSPGLIANKAIYLDGVNGVDVRENDIIGVGASGIHAASSSGNITGLLADGNLFQNVIVAMQTFNTRHSILRNNRLIRGPNTFNGPQIRLHGDVGPTVEGNLEQGIVGSPVPLEVSGP